jgi:hypothetical protein
VRPGGIGLIERIVDAPTASQSAVNPRLALRPEGPVGSVTREGDFIPRTVIQESGLEPPQNLRPGGFTDTEVSAFNKARGITQPEPITAPVLADIDFSSISGLIKGVGSVAEFAQNLQKFNRARGIVPGGKGKKQNVKTSDIQNMIEFKHKRIDEGLITDETELKRTIDELDILEQYMRGVTGIGTVEQNDFRTIATER